MRSDSIKQLTRIIGCTIIIVCISCLIMIYYISYTGRLYQKKLSETWQTYSFDPVTKEMSEDSVFETEIKKEDNKITVNYNSNSCTFQFDSGMKECQIDSKRVVFWFGENFDCVAIEEWGENKLRRIYLGIRDYIPFFDNTEVNRIDLIEKIALTGRMWD